MTGQRAQESNSPNTYPRGFWCAAFGAMVLFASSEASAQARVPVIERIDPTEISPGASFDVIARHIPNGVHAWIGEREARIISQSPTRVVVEAPEGVVSGTFSFRLADNSVVRGPEIHISRASAPTISSISSETVAPGGQLTIAGSNFSARSGDNVVSLNGLALPVVRSTSSELVVQVPSSATTGALTVAVRGQQSGARSLRVERAAGIDSFAPTRACAAMRVTIQGSGFTRGVQAEIGGTRARVVATEATNLVVEVPAQLAPGNATIMLTQRGQRWQSATPLTVVGCPRVSAIEPTAGIAGTRISLRGTNFGTDLRAVRVTVGGSEARVRDLNAEGIVIDAPATLADAAGGIEVSVADLAATCAATPCAFALRQPLRIARMEPENGPPGTVVRIFGEGFAPGLCHATQNGRALEVVESAIGSCSVRVVDGASSPIEVRVDGAGQMNTPRPFVVTHPPTVTSFTPALGPVGTRLTIRGNSFGSDTNVTAAYLVADGNVRVPLRIESVSPEQIVALVPTDRGVGTMQAHVEVEVRLQGSARATGTFFVQGAFRVQRLTPSSGYSGHMLTLTGEGFTTDTSVTFHGARTNAETRFANGTTLGVVVPDGATTGDITVRAPDGRTVTVPFTITTPEGFAVERVQRVCVRNRCTLRVFGFGFGSNARELQFAVGAETMRVTRATPYRLEVSVPESLAVAPIYLQRSSANTAPQRTEFTGGWQ